MEDTVTPTTTPPPLQLEGPIALVNAGPPTEGSFVEVDGEYFDDLLALHFVPTTPLVGQVLLPGRYRVTVERMPGS